MKTLKAIIFNHFERLDKCITEYLPTGQLIFDKAKYDQAIKESKKEFNEFLNRMDELTHDFKREMDETIKTLYG